MLALECPLTVGNARALCRHVADALGHDLGSLTIDASHVPAADAVGLAALTQSRRASRGAGVDCRVVMSERLEAQVVQAKLAESLTHEGEGRPSFRWLPEVARR